MSDEINALNPGSEERSAEHSYDAAKIEPRWQEFWRHSRASCVSGPGSGKPKYYVLDMFPYPSGEGLHVGHPLGYIASDIIARYKFLEGYEVLHPMGFDAFGLPAEQYAIQTGQHPAKSTAANISVYQKQLSRIGLGYDFEREVRTCDPSYYHWTQWAFIQMFEHWYDSSADRARKISELHEHLLSRGTHELHGVTHTEVQALSAEEYRDLDESGQRALWDQYRLAYRSEAMVNWCEELGTVLAHDEIQDGLSVRGGHPVTQKKILQWKLRVRAYAPRLLRGLEELDWPQSTKLIQQNWIGRSEGAEVSFRVLPSSGDQSSDGSITRAGDSSPYHELLIFTTRVDTLYGVTFMVLAPEHDLVSKITTSEQKPAMDQYLAEVQKRRFSADRYKETSKMTGCFTGAYAQHPLTEKRIPIWVSDYVLIDYGSGAIMAVPADDERDGRFAQAFGLEICENHTQGTPLEGLDRAAGQQKALELVSEKGRGCSKVSYRLSDAIFARQRYWGEPIPVYYCGDQPYTLDPSQLPLELPEVDAYLPTPEGDPPLARAHNWTSSGGDSLECSTMPGFAGSSAYFLRYMDPDNNDALVSPEAVEYWRQVDVYLGGSEHATGHLIYSRFWNMFLYDIGVSVEPEPFKKLIHQGMILGRSQYVFRVKGTKQFVCATLKHNYDTQRLPVRISLVRGGVLDGEAFKKWRPEFADAELITGDDGLYHCQEVVEKMSKSLYNTINPDEIVARYGADTLRLYEMFLGPLESTQPWSSEKIEGVHRFLKRFWKLFFRGGEWAVSDEKPTSKELRFLHETIRDVRKCTESYQFNRGIAAMMNAVNVMTKSAHPELGGKRDILTPLVILLAPYAPHICEELYARLSGDGCYSLSEGAGASYVSMFRRDTELPEFLPEYLKEDLWSAPVAVNGKVKFTIELESGLIDKEAIQQKVRAHERFQSALGGVSGNNRGGGGGPQIIKWIIVPGKMINLVVKK